MYLCINLMSYIFSQVISRYWEQSSTYKPSSCSLDTFQDWNFTLNLAPCTFHWPRLCIKLDLKASTYSEIHSTLFTAWNCCFLRHKNTSNMNHHYSLRWLACSNTFLLVFALKISIHALCFISNVYKQQFLGLVKFLEKLSNKTSLFWNLIRCLI